MKTVRYNKKTLFFPLYSEFIYFVEQKSKSEKKQSFKNKQRKTSNYKEKKKKQLNTSIALLGRRGT